MTTRHPPVVIFGTGPFASLVRHCLERDAGRSVAAFTVDAGFLRDRQHEGLPVVAFEELPSDYPPDGAELILPIGGPGRDALRRERFMRAKGWGYRFARYVSPSAVLWDGIEIGENCLLFERVIVQPFSHIGYNTILRAGANIGHHSLIGNHVFVAAGVVTGGNVRVGDGSFIGLGAIIRDNLSIGQGTTVGAGAVVLSDASDGGVYVGNPARLLRRE